MRYSPLELMLLVARYSMLQRSSFSETVRQSQTARGSRFTGLTGRCGDVLASMVSVCKKGYDACVLLGEGGKWHVGWEMSIVEKGPG